MNLFEKMKMAVENVDFELGILTKQPRWSLSPNHNNVEISFGLLSLLPNPQFFSSSFASSTSHPFSFLNAIQSLSFTLGMCDSSSFLYSITLFLFPFQFPFFPFCIRSEKNTMNRDYGFCN